MEKVGFKNIILFNFHANSVYAEFDWEIFIWYFNFLATLTQ